MFWPAWLAFGVGAEFSGGQTFTDWANDLPLSAFAMLMALLVAAIAHLIGQRNDCFGADVC